MDLCLAMMEQEKRQQIVELKESKYAETSMDDHLGEHPDMKMKEEQVSEETQTFPSAHSGYLGMPIKMEEDELDISAGHEDFQQNEAVEDSFPGFPIVTIKMEEEEESQASDNQDCEQGFSGVIIKMEPEEEPWISDFQQRRTMFSRVQSVVPKRKRSDRGNSDMPKRSRKVLPLSEKMKVIDLIRKEKKSFSEVAKIYGKNESSIREIVKKEKEIRACFAFVPHTAKVIGRVRDKCLVKMEKALNLWLEDMNRKSIPTDGNMLRQKALSLYEDFSKGSPETRDSKPFIASKGWLHRFRNRFGLRTIKYTGEPVSASEEAAATFPVDLKNLIMEKGYHPKQVFNCDETGLFWKKMPIRTYIHKNAKESPGHKTWKDRLTLVLCGNTAGHIIKPGVVYRLKNPRALKNKHHLPVFWQHNKKAWMTAILFMDWFHQCFIPQVKKYLEEEGLEFKVLLLIDSAPGHPESVCYENENVEVVFLPPDTTSLLQPLDQGVIWFVKATYTRLVFEHIISAIDADPNVDIMKCWNSFTIADAITLIKAAVDELKPETVNTCWKNLWHEVVNDFKDFLGIDEEVKKIIHAARQIGGEGFTDMIDEDVKEHIEGHREMLTNEELEELVGTSMEEEEEEESKTEPAMWTLPKFAEVFQLAQTLKDKIMEYDPWMERSIKVTRMITEGLQPLQEHFDELKRKRQLPNAMFFHSTKHSSTTDVPQPSASSTTDIQPSASSWLDDRGSPEADDSPSDILSEGNGYVKEEDFLPGSIKHMDSNTAMTQGSIVCCLGRASQYRPDRQQRSHKGKRCNKKPYKSSNYGKIFIWRKYFLTQDRAHTGEKPYTCSYCGKNFNVRSYLFAHERTHTGEKPHKCSLCGKGFNVRSYLIAHWRTHTGEKPHICSFCGKSFSGRSNLNRHQRSHTGEKPYTCSVCGRGFSHKAHMIRHERIHTGEKPYKCSQCLKTFSQSSTLISHERTHVEKPYKCSHCEKSFIQSAKLTIHERTHTGEKPYECPVCGKGFNHRSDYIIHERTHTGDKPYSCSICGKGFSGRSNLTRHERSHTGEKPYLCSLCGKGFCHKAHLLRHEKIHTGEKPYKCLVCGESFKHRTDLIGHERSHSGVKQYTCTACGKNFSGKSNLNRHKRSHTGEKPYTCLVCGRSFSHKAHLIRHERIHTGEKPYKCSHCMKSFNQSSTLVAHERTHREEKLYKS